MKLHFDLTNGISPDMALGALLDTGLVDAKAFQRELDKLPFRSEFELIVRSDYKRDVPCRTVVILDKAGLAGESVPRTFKDVVKMILSADISDSAKMTAVKIFETLARAEGRVQNLPPLSVSFSESGSAETLVGIAGTAIALDMIRPSRVTASKINTGKGFTVTPGGTMPVPTPVVNELLTGLAVFSDDRECELTDGGGAAIVRVVVSEFIDSASKGKCGCGGGERDFVNHSNVLRVYFGEDKREETLGSGGTPISDYLQSEIAKLEKPGKPAEENASAKKIEQIMSAMDDLENSFQNKPAAKQPERPKDDPANPQPFKLTQSVLLEKLREIEGKLQASGKINAAPKASEKNESLQKLEKLEREAPVRTAPAPEQKQIRTAEDLLEGGVLELTANIDNSTGEELGFLAELILANGAYDVYFEPIYMKKFRPAYKLSAVVKEEDLTLFSRLILRHSGAIGVRYTKLNRVALNREELVKDSPFGQLKFSRIDEKGDYPKYEEKRRVALERDLTLREIDRIIDSMEDRHEE